MRGEEIILVTLAGIDVAHHDEKAGMLEMCIGIYVDDRVVAYLHVVLAITLYGIHAHVWRIVWGFVAGKVAYVGTHVYFQYLGNVYFDIEVAVYIECRYRKCTLVAGVLIGNQVLPMEDAELEVLFQLGCQQIDA